MALLLAPLLACGPKVLADDTGDGASDTELDTTDDTSDTAGIGASTTGDPPDMTTATTTAGPSETTATTTAAPGTTTTTTGFDPDTATDSTGPDVPPPPAGVGSVVVLISRVGEGFPSGVEGIPQWVSTNEPECNWDMPGPCAGAPVLGEPQLLVDGVFADVDAIKVGSRVAVLLPFEHPGCAIGCGASTASVFDDVEGAGGGGSLPADFPCGTDGTGVWAALDFGEIVRSGKHEAMLRLDDACGAQTEPKLVQFTL